MFEDYPDIVDIATFCKMLDIGRTYAYRLINDKEIRCIRIGRKIRIPKVEVIRYVTSPSTKSINSQNQH